MAVAEDEELLQNEGTWDRLMQMMDHAEELNKYPDFAARQEVFNSSMLDGLANGWDPEVRSNCIKASGLLP